MITSAQIRLVQTARRSLSIGEDDYRALLRAEAGVDSSKDLDNAGFDRVLRRLETMGFSHTHRANPPRSHRHQPTGTITEEQQALIALQYDQLEQLTAATGNAGFATMQARMGFNKRQCRKQFPQTVSDGIRVIEGQKKYLERLRSRLETTKKEQ